MEKHPRPRTVTAAAILHFAIALAFLSIPLIGIAYGADVQTAAEAEVARQGQDPRALADNGIAFNETGTALWAPIAIAVLVALVGVLTMAGSRVGRVLSWIVLPLVLVGNFAIMASNAAVVSTLETYFADSGLQAIDVQALVDAAYAAYPSWLPAVEGARFAIVTLGCVLAVLLLALRPARAYFRKP